MHGKNQRLLCFQADDGFQINAVLHSGELENHDHFSDTPVVIHIHGVLGHFLARGTPRLLPPALLENGINSFSINTRMAFMGQIMGDGIFIDAVRDIDAAVDFVKREGFKKIFLLGYSLGANIAAYYASERADLDICGLILEGCCYSLPDSQKKRWNKWNSVPSYEQVYQNAKKVLGSDPYNSTEDQIFIVHRAWGDTSNPFHNEIYSYKTWWFMRSPEANNAKTHELITNVGTPILFLQGEQDDILEPWESGELARLASEAGNTDIAVKYIPNAKHDCMENSEETVKAIVDWIHLIYQS